MPRKAAGQKIALGFSPGAEQEVVILRVVVERARHLAQTLRGTTPWRQILRNRAFRRHEWLRSQPSGRELQRREGWHNSAWAESTTKAPDNHARRRPRTSQINWGALLRLQQGRAVVGDRPKRFGHRRDSVYLVVEATGRNPERPPSKSRGRIRESRYMKAIFVFSEGEIAKIAIGHDSARAARQGNESVAVRGSCRYGGIVNEEIVIEPGVVTGLMDQGCGRGLRSVL